MKRNWRRLKAATVWLVTLALLSTAAPGTGRAQAKPDDKGSGGQPEKKSTKHRSRKGAYILTFVGAGVLGAGVYQMTRRPSGKCSLEEAFPSPGTVRLCPIDFDSAGRKGTGALLIGFGSWFTVIGLLSMRHPKKTPPSQSPSGSAAPSSLTSRRLSMGHGEISGAQLGTSPTFNIGRSVGAKANYKIGMPQAGGFILRTPDLTAKFRANPD